MAFDFSDDKYRSYIGRSPLSILKAFRPENTTNDLIERNISEEICRRTQGDQSKEELTKRSVAEREAWQLQSFAEKTQPG